MISSRSALSAHPIIMSKKNGKEIYDGDIIRSFDSNGNEIIHYITWRETESRFVAVYDDINKWHIDLTRGLCQKWIDEYGKEIIGNIYDNPEILNK